jgi:UDP-glucose:(heptosyl)LPS alpha-1,3-glucosyltransferase
LPLLELHHDLKIAIVHPKFGALGGGAVAMRDVVDGLVSNAANRVTVFARWWQGEAAQHVRVVLLNPPYFGSLLRDWTFERAVRKRVIDRPRGEFDLVVSDQKIAGIDVYIAGGGVHIEWTRRKLAGRPWWHRVMGRIQPQHLYTALCERRVFGSPELRAVVCVSELVKRDVLRHFDVPPERVHVVYNGIDLERFDHSFKATHRQRLRGEMQLADKTVLLFIGGGMRNKGIVETLQAASKCGLDFELLVVGKDKHLHHFREIAERLGIAKRCRFLGAQSDVRPYYAVADIFVLPSHFETFGLVYLESLAMGVPVLVSQNAGASELIEDGRHGYRIDPNNVDDIAAKLQRLARSAAAMEADCVALARDNSRVAMAQRLQVVLAGIA